MKQTVTHWGIGTASSLGAVGITLTNIEQWVRVAGAFVGLVIGVLTLVSMIQRMRKGK